MIQPACRVLLFALFSLFAAHAVAQTDAATAESLMRKSGLWQQLDGVAAQMRGGLASAAQGRGARIKPAELARLNATVASAYAVDRLRAGALRSIASGTQAGDSAALLAWYGSEPGAGLVKVEEAAAAAEPRDPESVMREGAALFAGLPAARQALLRQFVEESHAAEGVLSITVSSTLAVQAGIASALGEGPSPSTRELREAMDAQRPQMLQSFTMMSLASFALIYSAVPDASLAAYVDFLKTPAGARYNALCIRAIEAALAEAATELGRGMPGARDGANT